VKLQKVVKQEAMVKEYLVKQPLMQARSVGEKVQGMLEEQVHGSVILLINNNNRERIGQ
jgi:hypothetical protein